MKRLFRRSRVPTILQMEATECGAASLGMILAHHGRWESLERLRVTCGVSRDGSKALNIVKAAREYGLEAKGLRKELEALPDVPTPFIVFWNFNHFLVVQHIDRRRGRVWLNDPANGRRRVSWEEFDEGYTGVCLTFAPGPNFHPGGDSPDLAMAVLPRLRGSAGSVWFLVLANLALVVPALVVPAFSKVFVDSVLVAGLQDWLVPLLLGLALTTVLRGALGWIQQIIVARLEMKLALGQASRFLWHLMCLPIGFFTQRHAGDLNSRVLAVDRVAGLLSGELANACAGVFRLVLFGAVMLAYDAMLASVAIALGVLNILITFGASRLRQDGSRQVARQSGLLASATMGGIGQIETIKASGTENEFFRRFTGTLANQVNANQALGENSTWLGAAPALVGGLANAAILGLGGMRVMSGELTVGDVVAFQALMQGFHEPLGSLVSFVAGLQAIRGDVARQDDVARYPPAPGLETTEAVLGHLDGPIRRLSGHIAVRDLGFGYNRLDPAFLAGISLDVTPGQHVALVGGSGSGKSTVARLLAGLYEPWSGDILFDGKPIAGLPHRVKTASVAVVDQDVFLLEGSVRDNVSLWDPTIPEADIVEALRDASLLEAVMARPGGIEGMVLDGGRDLSGGERQRMEIARALAGDPAILILDEATSALDAVAEARIMAAIRRRGMTCVIIAHRLSTVRDCDEIVVLESGQVVERGTHDSLIIANGVYQRLVGAE